jgi:hypothetical protein
MASGRNNQLTKQIGENLVVAELGRRGYIATAFAGNVPDIDILAVNSLGKTFPIQVKAIQGASWQFDIRTFLEVLLLNDTQVVKGKTRSANRKLLCIFVQIGSNGHDKFFIFRWDNLQDYFYATYKDGKRPRNPKSFHCAIWPKHLEKFRDNWKIIDL